MAAETFATSFLTNGADAGVALEIDKALTKPQREALIEAWKQAHQGPDRANIPTVLEGGMKLNRPTGTNKDAQLLELRSFQVEDIARLYGVPPHLIGLTEKQTSWGAGVEQMGLGFLTFHLVDWLVLWEAAIKRDLLDQPSDRDVYAEHLVDGLLRADFKTRMDGYGAAIANGILSRNEVRRKENLAPYAEGDRFLYPTNLAVAGADRSAADGEDAPTMPADRPASAWRKHLFKVERSIRGRSVANE
jgi:HK97 family phage portal protein